MLTGITYIHTHIHTYIHAYIYSNTSVRPLGTTNPPKTRNCTVCLTANHAMSSTPLCPLCCPVSLTSLYAGHFPAQFALRGFVLSTLLPSSPYCASLRPLCWPVRLTSLYSGHHAAQFALLRFTRAILLAKYADNLVARAVIAYLFAGSSLLFILLQRITLMVWAGRR